MKQTLLSLAALIGFAGAAKAQTTITLWESTSDAVLMDWTKNTQVIGNLNAFEAGDKLVAHISERIEEAEKFPQVALKGSDWKDIKLSGGNPQVADGQTTAEITLTQDNIDAIKAAGGFWLTGENVKISKLDWVPVRKFSTGTKLTTDQWFNIAKSEFEGANDDAVIVFNYTVETEKAEDVANWNLGAVSSQGDGTQKLNSTWGGLPNGNVAFTLKFSEIKDYLTYIHPTYNTQGINWNTWNNKTYKVTKGEVYLYNTASTPIANIEASDAEVVSTTYYSITGAASAEPAKGMNVVKEQLSDGNIRIRKIMVK